MDNMYEKEVPEGFKYTKEQAQALRCKLLEEKIIPVLKKTYFDKHPEIKSAMLCVAQYWDDEADDAVHASFIISELDEPDFDGARSDYDEDAAEHPTDTNLPTLKVLKEKDLSVDYSIARFYGMDFPTDQDRWGTWEDNGEAITLWSAWAEEGDQNSDFHDNYSPAVLIKRDGTYRFYPQTSPWSDGALSDWERENPEG